MLFNLICLQICSIGNAVRKICRHGHCEIVISLTSHEQKEAISPTGAVEQMRQFRRPPDQCSLYGARKASRCDLKGPKFRKASALRADGRQLHSLCIDILACRDETIRAITVIRLNLNPPFKNPRSATGLYRCSIPVQNYEQTVLVVTLSLFQWM